MGPCVSTLHSLSSDGGVVTAMDLVVIKVRTTWTYLSIDYTSSFRHTQLHSFNLLRIRTENDTVKDL